MDKIDEIIENLVTRTPMALARFNDGEMTGIAVPGTTIARGDQFVHKSLQIALVAALQHKQRKYYRGLPCGTCWPIQRKIADRVVNGFEDPYLTSAVVITNRNLGKFTEAFKHISRRQRVGWVGGENQDLNTLFQKGGIATSWYEYVDTKDSWAQYDEVRISIVSEMKHSHHKIDIVAFSCGPMSRVLVYTLFKQFPQTTFLDLGSVFDNYTKDYWLGCHDGSLAPCPECN